MALTPYQQSIWLTMWARNIGYAGVGLIMIAVLAVLGFRFAERQILIGLAGGAILFLVSDWIIRRIPDPDAPTEPSE